MRQDGIREGCSEPLLGFELVDGSNDDDGHRDGMADGSNDGHRDGMYDGSDDGSPLGLELGALEGLADWLVDGG